MSEPVRATVGISFFNAGKFLHQAIESVLSQTFSDFELILLDDGSTDDSLIVARSFGDPRIQLHADARNKGIAHRLNQMIDMAQGKYFVRMDADDLMFPDRLEKQIKFLDEHPEIDVVGSRALVIDKDNRILGLRDSVAPRSMFAVFRKIAFIHPTVTGRTEWFRTFRYAEKYEGVEDYDLWIRSFNHSGFYVLPEPLLCYRDPYKLHWKSYYLRAKKRLSCIVERRRLLGSITQSIILIVSVWFKMTVYKLASAGRFEHMVIATRNLPVKQQTVYSFLAKYQKKKTG